MTAEFGMKVNKVTFERSEDMLKPYGSYYNDACIDMSIHTDDGMFHLCGKNDWGYLMVDAIMSLLRYADQVEIALRRKLDNFCYEPEAIGLGKNEFRALDILHRLRGLDDPLSIYKGVPVVRIKDSDGIKIYGSKEKGELPFK